MITLAIKYTDAQGKRMRKKLAFDNNGEPLNLPATPSKTICKKRSKRNRRAISKRSTRKPMSAMESSNMDYLAGCLTQIGLQASA